MKLKLDLHDIYNGGRISIGPSVRSSTRRWRRRSDWWRSSRAKGTGQFEEARVLRFLDQKEIKALYDRVEKDSHNFGRVFVHFRPKRPSRPLTIRAAASAGVRAL